MSGLGILGGIGQGIAAGAQDLERMQRSKMLKDQHGWAKQQHERQQQDWAKEDAFDSALAGVKTEEFEDPQYKNFPTRDDEGNVMPGAKARAPHEVAAAKAQAAMGAAGNARQLATAQQLQQGARAERKAYDIDQWQARGQAMMGEFQKDPMGFFTSRVVPHYNTSIKDGHQAAVENYNGQQYLVTRREDGAPVGVEPMQLTPQLAQQLSHAYMEQLQEHALGALDPSFFQEGLKRRLQKRELDDNRDFRMGSLGIQEKELAAKVPYWDAGAQESRSKAKLMDRTDPNSTAKAYAATTFQPLGLSDDGTRMLGRQGGSLVEQAVPAGYGKLFPKVTGEKAPPRRFDSGSLGQLGLTQDDAGNPYTMDPKGNLVQVPMPGENPTLKALRELKGAR